MADSGRSIKARYKLEDEPIGSGGQGKIYKGILPDDNKTQVAAKEIVVKLQTKDSQNEFQMAEKMRGINHNNLVKYIEYKEETIQNRHVLWIIMEYSDHGNLQEFLTSCVESTDPNFREYLSECVRLKWMLDMAMGVEVLHSKNIVHRDLKPENILMFKSDGEIIAKISDFGISQDTDKMPGHDALHTTQGKGTPFYTAPEIDKNSNYTRSVDIFTLGLIYAVMLRIHPDISVQDFENLITMPRSINSSADQFLSFSEELQKWDSKLDSLYSARLARGSPKMIEIKFDHLLHIRAMINRMCELSPTERPNMHDVVALLSSDDYDAVNAPSIKQDLLTTFRWTLETENGLDSLLNRVNEVIDKDGQTLLHKFAAERKKFIIIQQLNLRYTDVEIRDPFGKTPFLIAVEQGHTLNIKALKGLNADVRACDNNRDSAIHLAARYEHTSLIPLLINYGISIDTRNSFGSTASSIAVMNKFQACLQELIKRGAGLNIADNHGLCPLHWACSIGHIDITEMLLQENVRIDRKDNKGKTALALAVQNTHSNCAKMLIQVGADTSLVDERGYTILHLAVEKGDLAIISTLLQKDVDVNVKDSTGQTPLLAAISLKSVKAAELLIEHGATDITIADSKGNTTLHYAIMTNHSHMIMPLIAKGAAKDVQNNEFLTPLHTAIVYENESCITELINAGVSINLLDARGYTPLENAVANRLRSAISMLFEKGASLNTQYADEMLFGVVSVDLPDVIQHLLAKGADVNWPNEVMGFMTPLLKAIECDSAECLEELLKGKPDTYTLMKTLTKAVTENKSDMITTLIKYGANPNETLESRRGNDTTILHAAARLNCVDVAKVLIDTRAHVNAENDEGLTPLSDIITDHFHGIFPRLNNDWFQDKFLYPFVEEMSEMAELLVANGASVNMLDLKCNSLLHYAAKLNLHQLMDIAIEKGAEINARNTDGKTPLALSLLASNGECANKLLDHAADIKVVDKENNTMLHFAARSNLHDILQKLVDPTSHINAKNAEGLSPLEVAINEENIKCAAWLMKHKADVTYKNNKGETLLHIAARKNLIDLISPLTEAGEVIHLRNDDEQTPLTISIENGNVKFAYKMISLNSNTSIVDSKGKTLLHYAAKSDIRGLIPTLLDGGTLINAKCSEGYTPLARAIIEGNHKFASDLVDRKADIKAISNDDFSILYLAAYSKTHDSLELLSTKCLGVNTVMGFVDKKGNTLLHIAVELNHIKKAKWLLKRNANMNAKNMDNTTPLTLAIENNRVKILNMFLNKGAEMNYSDKNGNTLLHIAVISNHIENAECLIRRGAYMNAKNKDDKSPLTLAMKDNRVEILDTLLNEVAEMNYSDEEGNTLLHIAAELGHVEQLILLIDKGADVNAENNSGDTPLVLAMLTKGESYDTYRSPECALELLKNGADLHIDPNQPSYLHLAVKSNMNVLIKHFIDKGIDINVKDSMGKTPLSKILTIKSAIEAEATIRKLYGFMIDINCHDDRDEEGNNCITELIRCGADVNETDSIGNTLLHFAAQCHLHLLLSILLQKKAHIDVQNYEGCTPLIAAIVDDNTIARQKLIEHEADVNLWDNLGQTPLHLARDISATTTLITHGANINATDNSLCTPLVTAIQSQNSDIAKDLIKQGADVNLFDMHGNTPLHYAAKLCIPELVEILIAKGAILRATNHCGHTPLDDANSEENSTSVDLLLKHYALCKPNRKRNYDVKSDKRYSLRLRKKHRPANKE